MDWSPATGWWVAAGVLVAVEMVTGTFYLLMLALGAAAAALAAHAGAATALQWVVGALAGGGATAVWHFKRTRHPRSQPAATNRDVNLDIGSTVRVDAWSPDGTARVTYRGAAWSARHVGPGAPRAGTYVIASVEGNELGLRPGDPP